MGRICPRIFTFRRDVVQHLWYFIFLVFLQGPFCMTWGSGRILFCSCYHGGPAVHYLNPIQSLHCLGVFSFFDSFLGIPLIPGYTLLILCCISVGSNPLIHLDFPPLLLLGVLSFVSHFVVVYRWSTSVSWVIPVDFHFGVVSLGLRPSAIFLITM